MKNSIVLYFRLLSISIRGQLQYRGSFLLFSVGHFLTTGVEALGVFALFDRFGNLTNWNLEHVAVFYGVVNIAFAITEATARGFDIFGARLIRTGDFDRILLRPRNSLHLVAGWELQLHRVGRMLQGLLVLCFGLYHLETSVTLSSITMIFAALLGAILFFYGVLILQATMSFWTIESLEIVNVITYGGVETAQYPMAIYKDDFRRFFTYVIPIACVAYYPLLPVLGIDDPVGTTRTFQVFSPLAGAVFFAFSLCIWQLGVRYYKSTGS